MAKASYSGDGTYPGSYYAASRNIVRTPRKLEGAVETDICVIGGGYTGLSTSIHLAEKGYKVTLVEGAQIGWGASGRNGGQVVNGLNASLDTIKRRYGDKAASFVGGMVQEGAQTIYRLIEQYGIDCDLKPGNIYAAFTPAHMRELEAKKALWESYGMNDHVMLDARRYPQGSRLGCLCRRHDGHIRRAPPSAQSDAWRSKGTGRAWRRDL